MMADYRIILTNGYVHEGDDERSVDQLLVEVVEGGGDDLPKGWVWIASLYVRCDQVAAIVSIPWVAT